VQIANPTNAEQVNHSTHIQPLHQSALPENTSRAPLKAVPPIVTSCISTRAKSRAPCQFMLDHVAPFVANLKSNVVAPHPTRVGEPCGTMLPLDIQRTFPNNKNNLEWHPRPVHTLWMGKMSKRRRVQKMCYKDGKEIEEVYWSY
jgi:hypothetical protein